MKIVTVSPKYQVVIPSEVRSRLKLKPGQKIVFIEEEAAVRLVPIGRGFKRERQRNVAQAVLLNEKLRRKAPKGWDSAKVIRYWRDKRR